jgi:hypothetical protein
MLLLALELVACSSPPSVAIGEGGKIANVPLGSVVRIPYLPPTRLSGYELFLYEGVYDGSYVLYLNGDNIPSYVPIGKTFTFTLVSSNHVQIEISNITYNSNGTISLNWTRVE